MSSNFSGRYNSSNKTNPWLNRKSSHQSAEYSLHNSVSIVVISFGLEGKNQSHVGDMTLHGKFRKYWLIVVFNGRMLYSLNSEINPKFSTNITAILVSIVSIHLIQIVNVKLWGNYLISANLNKLKLFSQFHGHFIYLI